MCLLHCLSSGRFVQSSLEVSWSVLFVAASARTCNPFLLTESKVVAHRTGALKFTLRQISRAIRFQSGAPLQATASSLVLCAPCFCMVRAVVIPAKSSLEMQLLGALPMRAFRTLLFVDTSNFGTVSSIRPPVRGVSLAAEAYVAIRMAASEVLSFLDALIILFSAQFSSQTRFSSYEISKHAGCTHSSEDDYQILWATSPW